MNRILHIAVENFAGVPYDFYRMHNSCGDFSRLVTLHGNIRGFSEDICLNFPISRSGFAQKWRRKKHNDTLRNEEVHKLHYFKPKNYIEQLYFDLTDSIRTSSIEKAIRTYNLDGFSIIHYDGGLDFTRKPKKSLEWKKQGKKIVTCYYGSDLRARGIIKELDEITDLRLTSEFDHLDYADNIHYLFYPYDTKELPDPIKNETKRIRIVHSPTNRQFKGTNGIIKVIEKLSMSFPIDFFLLENKSREKVLEIKRTCDICIDQVGGLNGGTGYGKSGLETLSMEIPTITNMTEQYSRWLPENPFVVANNINELEDSLVNLIEQPDLRRELGIKGKKWVHTYHGYSSVNSQLYTYYKKFSIL